MEVLLQTEIMNAHKPMITPYDHHVNQNPMVEIIFLGNQWILSRFPKGGGLIGHLGLQAGDFSWRPSAQIPHHTIYLRVE